MQLRLPLRLREVSSRSASLRSTVVATDNAGLKDTCHFNVTVNDTQKPAVTCPANIVESVNPGQTGKIVNFVVGATDNCPGVVVVATPASGSLFPLGTTPVMAIATDAHGLADTCNFTVTISQHPKPNAICQAVTVNADGTCHAAASIDNGSNDSDGDPITIVQVPAGPYPLGTTLVALIVTDSHGAADTCHANVTVQDKTKPTIACPANIVKKNDVGQAGAIVTFTVTATDACDPVPVVAATPPSGSFFPIGVTAVKAIATDASGNADTCNFTVTISENQKPVVSGIPDQILPYGSTFATINLDTYVTDPDNTPSQMTWTYAGNTQLLVSISPAHVATITKPSPSWSGSESIIFTATDPGLFSDSDTAVFSIAAPTPLMKITPDSLIFTGYVGGANPAGQGAMVTNIGNGTLDWTAAETTAWFNLSSASGTAPSGFTVTVDITGLGLGDYYGDVTVSSAQATNSPRILKVILHVKSPVDIKLTPDSLSFYARQGSANPASQNVSITNALPSGVEFDWDATKTAPWLSLSAISGRTPSTVGFSVDISGLGIDTYNTIVVIKQTAMIAGVVDDADTVYVKLIVDTPTGIEDDHGSTPKSYSLEQNFPNPFNPETVIGYNLASPGYVTLTVYNVIGQKIVDVVNGFESAGAKQATWNGKDANGREVQSGIYFYRLTTDNFTMTRKMMLLK